MENFILYITKVSGLLAVFFIAYHIFLRKETFFNANRWFLLAGMLTSLLLPLVIFTQIVWIDPAPAPIALEELTLPMHNTIQSAAVRDSFTINWYYVGGAIYLAGMLFFLIRFLYDFASISKLLHKQQPVNKDSFKMVDTKAIQSPFSFFKYIVYNSAVLQPEELDNIIRHEKVHSTQLHSLDTLSAQLFAIILWCNPFAWLYKKAVCQNLEFIADAEATKQITDRIAYQKTLLKITMQPECIAITNHFYQSLIKKRIVMLNKPNSKRRNAWKYALVLPALGAFVLLFQMEVIAQERESEKTAMATQNTKPDVISSEITKDATEEELNTVKSLFKQEFDADVTFSNIIRNSKGEITAIKVTVKDKDTKDAYPVYEVTGDKNDKPITLFHIVIEHEKGSDKNVVNFTSSLNKEGDKPLTVKANEIKIGPSLTRSTESFEKEKTDTDNQYWKLNYVNVDGKKALIVINGVVQEYSEFIKISNDNEIEKVNILKGDKATTKYGNKGSNGVIEIFTLKGIPANGIAVSDIESGKAFKINTDIDITTATTTFLESIDEMTLKSLKEALIQLEESKKELANSIKKMDDAVSETKAEKAENDRIKKQLQTSKKQIEESHKQIQQQIKALEKKRNKQ